MTSPAHPLKRPAKTLTPAPRLRRWHEFRWPHRCVRWLPGSSLSYGPARHWVQARDYLARHPGEMREVLPAQHLPASVFHRGNEIPARFFARIQRDIPAASVLRLPHVRLMGEDGWIVGADDSFLLDASYHLRPDAWMDMNQHYMLGRRRARPLRRLGGRTLSLASDFACGGFAHFIHDSVCRLHLLELAGINPADYDHIFWPRPPGASATAIVRASGLPEEKLLNADWTHDLLCDDLTATTFPGLPAHLTPPYIDFLRRRFAPAPLGRNRKIYLERAGFRRNFRNAPEIAGVLARAGYESCLPHADPDVLAKCAAASRIVSLEGSNFFNAFAVPAGGKALIVIPDAGQTLPYTLSLAAHAGLDTHLLLATSLTDGPGDPVEADVHLDPELLARTLEKMEAAA